MRKKYWQYGLAHRDEDIREIEVSTDGLMIRAKLLAVADLLQERPSRRSLFSTYWYFNNTHDRLIAEMSDLDARLDIRERRVTFNPQLLWQAGFTVET